MAEVQSNYPRSPRGVVRAKFRVSEISRTIAFVGKEVQTVKMVPVHSEDPESENRKFWEATPTGSVELGCANLEAVKGFELGQEFYLDFRPAE